MKSLLFFIAIVFSLSAAWGETSWADDYSRTLVWAKVVRIFDGDTVAVQNDEGQTIRVQLAYIDAPDMDTKTGGTQPLYRESMDFLAKLVLNKEVIIESLGKDKFKRIEGIIFIGKTNINLEMVRKGMAEIYYPVRVKPSRYKQRYVRRFNSAEKLARKMKTGVWGAEGYISPYKFRRRGK